MRQNIIEVKDLNVSYDKDIALENINIEIPSGVRCAIIGPNGSGKSTLLKSILGLKNIDKGEIKVFGEKIGSVNSKIAYVPQKSTVNWNFPITVLDVVMMGRYSKKGLCVKNKSLDKEIAISALKEMKMENFVNRHISELSGGQKQRVFIARALAQDADLYLLDEPLTGVDIKTEEIIQNIFIELQKKGKTIVSVHHNLYTIDKYFDYLIVLNKTLKKIGWVEDSNPEEYIQLAFKG
ncbi:metal ABC transporter ATP-binding protein [Helcococcus kunzii]|uniref:metal ABC transporter ATP-binding protein n=1 Tax=Helcococcus kunzii TaxID=40091 RepID=UPI001BAED67F|nr:ABC transporter ATP-binding protein [Helcococcus kunzii]QUY64360.1 ABC transporter ATP-binding protein [Helcococcus kunzii]